MEAKKVRSEMHGFVQTVQGLLDPNKLGKTLMHEHVLVDYSKNFGLPSQDTKRAQVGGLTLEEQQALWKAPLSLENLGHVQHYFNQPVPGGLECSHASHLLQSPALVRRERVSLALKNCDNMILDEVDVMTEELEQFKKIGGSTIVDCTSRGMYGNPIGLKKISEDSGVHIVTGTGYYLARVHPPEVSSWTVEHMAETFINDICSGIGDTGVPAGFIGELGCTTKLHADEKKVLQAAAIAQQKTGVLVIIHPGYSVESPVEILDILEAAGADLSRVVMSHVDRGILSLDDMLLLAKRGCVLMFDQFGWPLSFTHALSHGIDYPSDFVRCKMISELKSHGYLHQVAISHDVAFKMRLSKYGGSSYGYILKNIIPYMLKRGFAQQDITMMLVETPKRLLTII